MLTASPPAAPRLPRFHLLYWCSDTIIGFVNSIKTVDGGTHIDGAKAALTRTGGWREVGQMCAGGGGVDIVERFAIVTGGVPGRAGLCQHMHETGARPAGPSLMVLHSPL